ncbi:hypothetical protein [Paenibacillus tengchongensis]|uniref:hypothetical protein n=1 Tax=Paenibacillus tengchongensis TaxID=2608684 RepID=UPI00124E208E|nr:hypothetical protein [Paenibacillus tengchongensis]
MIQVNTVDAILEALKSCGEGSISKTKIAGSSYKFTNHISDYRNQFLIMVKPECLSTLDGVDVRAIIGKLLELFNLHQVRINDCCAISGTYLKEHKLIELQYSILNKGAKQGLDGYTESYRKVVEQEYKDRTIIGAYPFLQTHTNISEETLEKNAHKVGSHKIGNGTYMLLFEDDTRKYGIINAFHPHQVLHFNKEEHAILTFDCSSNTDYHVLTSELIGVFNPSLAKKDSLRGFIYSHQEKLGLKNVGVFLNGFHISPSPLEGMFATMRYFTNENNRPVSVGETNLGLKLIDSGFSEEQILQLSKNPYVWFEGSEQSIYDIAEDKDTDFIVKFIKNNFSKFEFI